ncbi:MAG: hypothetical protein OEZ14_12740 [Acidimicrobiia bacterium]|nr:hypothetical protein [Acidimicrobiia bacterium]
MHGDKTDGGTDPYRPVRKAAPSWYRPLGSAESARKLADVVAERLDTMAGSGPIVDVETGVVRSQDGLWSASLAPLAARLAHLPAGGWPIVVDREIERWHRVATTVRRPAEAEAIGRPRPGGSPLLLRLTAAVGPTERTLRPAFGAVAWELVRDLGPDGLAALPHASCTHRDHLDPSWDRIAAGTVARHERNWARLTLDDGLGTVLSGPYVSVLLYEPGRLFHQLDESTGTIPLRIAVFTNSLLLVTMGEDPNRLAAGPVAESLRRFTAGSRRDFEPFIVDLPAVEVRSNPVTPM